MILFVITREMQECKTSTNKQVHFVIWSTSQTYEGNERYGNEHKSHIVIVRKKHHFHT